jgi:hypothetical protein
MPQTGSVTIAMAVVSLLVGQHTGRRRGMRHAGCGR